MDQPVKRRRKVYEVTTSPHSDTCDKDRIEITFVQRNSSNMRDKVQIYGFEERKGQNEKQLNCFIASRLVKTLNWKKLFSFRKCWVIKLGRHLYLRDSFNLTFFSFSSPSTNISMVFYHVRATILGGILVWLLFVMGKNVHFWETALGVEKAIWRAHWLVTKIKELSYLVEKRRVWSEKVETHSNRSNRALNKTSPSSIRASSTLGFFFPFGESLNTLNWIHSLMNLFNKR